MSVGRLFIASSSAAKQQFLVEWVSKFVENFDVRPWYEEFPVGQYTLESLNEQCDLADFAIIVFAKDDCLQHVSGTVPTWVPRDNVVFECGLFIQALKRERVAILLEQGTKVPIDLAGITVLHYRSDEPHIFRADLEAAAKKLNERWKPMAPRTREATLLFSDAGLGFKDAVEKSQKRLNKLASRLTNYTRSRKPDEIQPFWFDSESSAVSTYAEALNLVCRRFNTTTFMSSGFWTTNNAEVIAANRDLLRRVGPEGDVRRLFMLPHSIERELEAQREERVFYMQRGMWDAIAQRDALFKILRISIGQQLRFGCGVRIAFDSDEWFRMLPTNMNFDHLDCEVAIYDDARVDVFTGGRAGRISGVRCYTAAMEDFAAYLGTASDYFEGLWSSGVDILEYFDEVRLSHESAADRIDYETNWLLRYEFLLDEEDHDLKVVEINRMREFLNELGLWGRLSRVVDVGTCTGRYPIYFVKEGGLAPDGRVVGIDADIDCVSFARANVKMQCPGETRIEITKHDVQLVPTSELGECDAVTCMLGTLSHFGRGRQKPTEHFDDGIQRALGKMTALLRPGGLLVLGTWSGQAKSKKDMLGIYTQGQRDRLAEWTPPLEELRAKRLPQAGLELVRAASPHARLDLTIARRIT